MKALAAIALLVASATAAVADTFVYVALQGDKKIATYHLDPTEGKLTHRSDVKIDGEPGALTTDPKQQFLFAAIGSEGNLAAFKIDRATGKLTHVNTVPAGPDPAHIATDRTGRFLLSAYYVAAKVTVHAIGKDGALSEKPVQTIMTADKAHAILPDPSNRFVFVPHTGPNAIFQFTFQADPGKLAANAVPKLSTPDNTGPRHIVFHPSKDLAYVDNEQGGSVTAYALDSKAGKNELLFQHGINFNDVPNWQRQGVGLYWESYETEGYNPKLNQKVTAWRRRIKVDCELPMKEEYGRFIQRILTGDSNAGTAEQARASGA